MYPICSVVTKSEMVSQRNRMDAVSVASCMLRSKVAKGVPISTHVDLLITSGIISKGIQRCTISIALNGLL